MKNFNKIYAALALTATFSLTGCIKETFPEDSVATAEQVQGSASALEGAVNGISSQMAQGYLVYGEQEQMKVWHTPGLNLESEQ